MVARLVTKKDQGNPQEEKKHQGKEGQGRRTVMTFRRVIMPGALRAQRLKSFKISLGD